jgi:hypothetical protein
MNYPKVVRPASHSEMGFYRPDLKLSITFLLHSTRCTTHQIIQRKLRIPPIIVQFLHLEFLAGFCCNYLIRTTLTLFLAINALLLPIKVWAWGAAGHQLIAAGAFRQLSPQLKAQANEVL